MHLVCFRTFVARLKLTRMTTPALSAAKEMDRCVKGESDVWAFFLSPSEPKAERYQFIWRARCRVPGHVRTSCAIFQYFQTQGRITGGQGLGGCETVK